MDIFLKFLIAFAVGGLICTIGQILILKTKLTPARILVSFVALGVLLQATTAFKYIQQVAGAGITVPITGFGGVLAAGVIEAVEKYGFLGIFTGGLAAAAAGVAVTTVAALVVALIFRSKSK